MMGKMGTKTRGQLEAEISDAIIQFEKEYMGRGPLETKTYIIDDLVIVRLKGVLIQAERQLAESNEASTGRELIKRMRHALLEKGRPMLDAIVRDVVGVPVVSLHTDLSTVTGERLIVFSLAKRPDLPGSPQG
ncbi:MAG: DUF2294 domain-containing protein [Pelovirga sp.]